MGYPSTGAKQRHTTTIASSRSKLLAGCVQTAYPMTARHAVNGRCSASQAPADGNLLTMANTHYGQLYDEQVAESYDDDALGLPLRRPLDQHSAKGRTMKPAAITRSRGVPLAMPVQCVFNFNRVRQPAAHGINGSPGSCCRTGSSKYQLALDHYQRSARFTIFVHSVPPIPCKPSINKDTGKASRRRRSRYRLLRALRASVVNAFNEVSEKSENHPLVFGHPLC